MDEKKMPARPLVFGSLLQCFRPAVPRQLLPVARATGGLTQNNTKGPKGRYNPAPHLDLCEKKQMDFRSTATSADRI
jgi:hypothetical protein